MTLTLAGFVVAVTLIAFGSGILVGAAMGFAMWRLNR